jgi:mxaJ protein
MCSRFLRATAAASLIIAVASGVANARELRVCTDPDNLPYSNAREEGFENKLMLLIGRQIGVDIRFVWEHQWRGFLRKTLRAGICDVIPGMAVGTERARLTKPYYTSTYVFVTRRDRPPISAFADLSREMTVGVQLVGDDGANTPPVEEMASRGIGAHLKGFMVWGQSPSGGKPLEAIMRAVAEGSVDVAVVWGPQAGYFATRESAPLAVTPIPAAERTTLPMRFDIAMGVRMEDEALAVELDAALSKLTPEIRVLLDSYGVPRAETASRKGAMR